MAGSGYTAAQCQAVLDAIQKSALDGAGKSSVTTDGITISWNTAFREQEVKQWTRRLRDANRREKNAGELKRARGVRFL